MSSELSIQKLLLLTGLILIIVLGTLVVGFVIFKNNNSLNGNSTLNINSINVRHISQSEYNSYAYYGQYNSTPPNPPPAKIVYGLTLNLTLFLNKTYNLKIWEPPLGICTFGANLINSSNWELVVPVYHCPIINKYPSGYNNFSISVEMIPTNYNATISYPFQIILSAQSYFDSSLSIKVVSQPFTLQITN